MNCPDCGEYLHQPKKCSCGWIAPAETMRYRGPAQPVRNEDWEKIKRTVCDNAKALAFKATRSREWAYKILEKHARGEAVDLVALRNAQQAVRFDPNGESA